MTQAWLLFRLSPSPSCKKVRSGCEAGATYFIIIIRRQGYNCLSHHPKFWELVEHNILNVSIQCMGICQVFIVT